MKKIFYFFFSTFALLCFFTPVMADTYVTGDIMSDSTWTSVNGPYYVEDVNIPSGVTLRVDSGTEIFVTGYFSVSGAVDVIGRGNSPVAFKPNPDTLSWYMHVEGGKLILNNTTLNQVESITGSHGDVEMTDVSIVDPIQGVIMVDQSRIKMHNVQMLGLLDGGALSVSRGSTLELQDGYIEGAISGGDYVVSAYQDSLLTMSGTTVSGLDNVPVIAVGSDVNIQHVSLSGGSGDAIDVFPSNVGRPHVTISDTTVSGFLGNGIFAIDSDVYITKSKLVANGTGLNIIARNGAEVSVSTSTIALNNNGLVFINQSGVSDSSSININVSGNWWGDASGPYVGGLNDAGQGNPIISPGGQGYVKFRPWLLSNPDNACCSSVLFIPGIKASRLYREQLTENQLWEPNRNADVEKLFLDSSGKSIDPTIYTRDIIASTNIGLSLFDRDIYKNFIASMDAMVKDGLMKEWKAFPYDWRLNYDDLIENGVKLQNEIVKIIPEIESLAANSNSGKVTLVTHSNGGLFAKVLVSKLQELGKDGLIDNLIMVAAPQLGTPDAIPALLHGDNQQIKFILDKSVMRTLGENMKPSYNLLPSLQYFNRITDPVVTFDQSVDKVANFRTVYGESIDSYNELADFLLARTDKRTKPLASDTIHPNVLRDKFVSDANTMHTAIDTWVPPSTINLTQIAGWGISTTKGIKYLSRVFCLPGTVTCLTGLDHESVKSIDGDGTVLSASAVATVGEGYYVNIRDYNRGKVNIDHGSILEIPNLELFIRNIIEGKSTDIPEFITKDKPVDTENPNIRIAMHSPVAIDAYDDAGQHAGLVTVPGSDILYIENSIPNSQYEEVGEGKYIYIDGAEVPTIKLQGLDSGTFSLSIQIQNGGTVSESNFLDIPTNPNMEGQVLLTATSTSLVLDIEGDGKNDVTVGANVEMDPITYLTVIKKTINGFNINVKTKNELIKRIDGIIKLIEKGKVKNAIKKIKDFNKKLQSAGKHHHDRHGHKKLNKTDADTFTKMLNELLDLLEAK